jgi:hypothetical protein
MLLLVSLSDARISQSALNLLTGLFLAVATALVTIATNWIRERDARVQRAKELDEAIKIVSFWESWLKNIETLKLTVDEDFRMRAQTQMFDVSRRVEGLVTAFMAGPKPKPTRQEFLVTRRSLPWWRRWLLLYRPGRKWAWVPRIVFYYSITVGVPGSWPIIRSEWLRHEADIKDAERTISEADAERNVIGNSLISQSDQGKYVKRLLDNKVKLQEDRIFMANEEQQLDIEDLIAAPVVGVFLFFIAWSVEKPRRIKAKANHSSVGSAQEPEDVLGLERQDVGTIQPSKLRLPP